MTGGLSRRRVLETAGALAAGPAAAQERPALIAISLDLEMSRQFPTPDQLHWDYEKGNLNAETKAYALEAARRVRRRGGVIHFFALGRTMEQEDIGWLQEIVRLGHPVGNHTYDHVNVTAARMEDVQFRFRRSPWLVEGKTPAEVVADNVRMAHRALEQRAGVRVRGFRTPGGFHRGLDEHPAVRRMLWEQGYRWVSSRYPNHPLGEPGREPDAAILAEIVKAQDDAQPYRYPDGLVEVPMSPISDVTAFRSGRWKLEWFLRAIGMAVGRAIERRACFDFLAHPSCLYVVDPEFRAIDLICDRVAAAAPRALLADLDQLAARAPAARTEPSGDSRRGEQQRSAPTRGENGTARR